MMEFIGYSFIWADNICIETKPTVGQYIQERI